MLNVPQRIKGIYHPAVQDMYLKKDYTDINNKKNVLVIETLPTRKNENEEHDGFDSYLVDLLVDLHSLKDEARKKAGPFSRVDIRQAN